MNNYKYCDLDKHFTAPKQISPFYPDNIRIPRKLKSKVKNFCGIFYNSLTNGQRLWYYMESNNKNYRTFLIKSVCSQ